MPKKSFDRSIKKILSSKKPGEKITLQGWLRSIRVSKERSFLDITDGSCHSGLQAVMESSISGYDLLIKKLATGCSLEMEGELVSSPAAGQKVELQIQSIEIIGNAPEEYPLQKKRHSFEFLRTIGHLRMRTNTLSAVMRVRNTASMAVHDFFQSRGFFWLHTPIITSSDCEGAGAMFRATSLDLENLPRNPENKVDYTKDFFGRTAHLTVSGQLEAEIGALALSHVYTFGPTFRAENSNTSRHLAEFWMIEPEMAFCDLEQDQQVAEDFLRFVIKTVLEKSSEDLQFFDKHIEKGLLQRLDNVTNSEFARLTYTEAVKILEKENAKFSFPVSWGVDLQSEHERYLTEVHCQKPVIVTDYPKNIKSFYMYLNQDEKTVRAMDVLMPQIGEIIGGSQREDREDILKQRMLEQNLRPEDYWWYLELRRFGSVPHAGFGLGFERLILALTGMNNIRDVIPFPRVPGHAEF